MGSISFLYKNVINSIKKSISSSLGLNLSKPLQISIQPNERCNARCIMCDCWKEKNDYLNSDEIIDALKQLNNWVGSNFFVQIAGGEPLIFNGIYDIFSFCEDNNIICKISTNGIALTENTCDKIIKSKLRYLSVSIDSHLPEIHDKYRGVDGTLERSLKGIEYLAKNGNLTLGISSVIMRDNISTLCDSIDFFLKLPINRLLLQPIRIWTENIPVSKWSEYKYWVNDENELNHFIEHLLIKKKEDARVLNTEKDIKDWSNYFTNPASFVKDEKKKCEIGYDGMSINYKGDIYLGCAMYGSIGNIKQDKLKDAWKSPKAKKIRQQMKKCKYPCTSNCYKELTLKEKIIKVRLFIKSGLFEKKGNKK